MASNFNYTLNMRFDNCNNPNLNSTTVMSAFNGGTPNPGFVADMVASTVANNTTYMQAILTSCAQNTQASCEAAVVASGNNATVRSAVLAAASPCKDVAFPRVMLMDSSVFGSDFLGSLLSSLAGGNQTCAVGVFNMLKSGQHMSSDQCSQCASDCPTGLSATDIDHASVQPLFECAPASSGWCEIAPSVVFWVVISVSGAVFVLIIVLFVYYCRRKRGGAPRAGRIDTQWRRLSHI